MKSLDMKSKDTRKKMIDTAILMFQEHGYHGVSWRKLVKEAGTPWGSIAHHFPDGKMELAIAAIEAGAKAVNDLICYCFEKEPDAAAAVNKWFKTTASHIEKAGFQIGCPVASIALSTTPQVAEIDSASYKAFSLWEETIANSIRHTVKKQRASEIAKTIITLLEGGIVRTRIEKSKIPLETAGKEAAGLITNNET